MLLLGSSESLAEGASRFGSWGWLRIVGGLLLRRRFMVGGSAKVQISFDM